MKKRNWFNVSILFGVSYNALKTLKVPNNYPFKIVAYVLRWFTRFRFDALPAEPDWNSNYFKKAKYEIQTRVVEMISRRFQREIIKIYKAAWVQFQILSHDSGKIHILSHISGGIRISLSNLGFSSYQFLRFWMEFVILSHILNLVDIDRALHLIYIDLSRILYRLSWGSRT